MTQKILSVTADQADGFCLDPAFFDAVIDDVEERLATEIPRDSETMEVTHALIASACAHFMTTFEVKKQ